MIKASELFLFALVGVVNTSLSYALYALGLYFGASYLIANMLSMFVGIVVGFLGQGRFVFNNKRFSRIGRYLIMWVLLIALHALIVNRTIAAGYSAYAGGLFAVIPVVTVSYLIQKFYVFRGGGEVEGK